MRTIQVLQRDDPAAENLAYTLASIKRFVLQGIHKEFDIRYMCCLNSPICTSLLLYLVNELTR